MIGITSLTLATALLITQTLGAAVADRWPQFRGPESLGVADGTGLPDTWSTTQNVAWKIDKRTHRLVVMSAIDNIVKGASGQAVQCMNLMLGLPETAGLN